MYKRKKRPSDAILYLFFDAIVSCIHVHFVLQVTTTRLASRSTKNPSSGSAPRSAVPDPTDPFWSVELISVMHKCKTVESSTTITVHYTLTSSLMAIFLSLSFFESNIFSLLSCDRHVLLATSGFPTTTSAVNL